MVFSSICEHASSAFIFANTDSDQICLARSEHLENREVKHDVYGKRQTANGKNETFAVSLRLFVQYSEIICICNE